jgi:uncharacterized protein (TIGR02646 family)
MRRLARPALPRQTQNALDRRQDELDAKRATGQLNPETEWRSARRTKALKSVAGSLKRMAGRRERCMYCCDSKGTDIDHFWPKSGYPERMFRWANLLLCCSECGRFKGSRFPVVDAVPQLIDPTSEDPWTQLDFDPDTGVIVARYDAAAERESSRGAETVRILQLDRREALNDGYLKTWRRLSNVLAAALRSPVPDARELTSALRDADDHGLLGWCFGGTGKSVAPFSDLRTQHPTVWNACAQAFA